MKEITITCKDGGKAKVKTEDIHLNRENSATKVVLDFSETEYADKPKWLDIVSGSGEAFRYDLGDDEKPELELKYENTLSGRVTFTPFIYDGSIKVKYKTNYDIVIKDQPEAGDKETATRDDFIFELEQRLNETQLGTWEEIYDGDPIGISTSETTDITTIEDEEIEGRVFAFELYLEATYENPIVKIIEVNTDFDESEDPTPGAFVGDILKVEDEKMQFYGCEIGFSGDVLQARNPQKQDFNKSTTDVADSLAIRKVWRIREERSDS